VHEQEQGRVRDGDNNVDSAGEEDSDDDREDDSEDADKVAVTSSHGDTVSMDNKQRV
jgi:hypothetical protein